MSVQREGGSMEVPVVEACEEFVEGVATQDVQVGDDVWVRIFLPAAAAAAAAAAPMPLVFYAHGGAYCLGQPHWLPFHAFCSTMSKLSHSIWVSLSYRLAPAHRLPAAFHDASLALSWLVSQAQQRLPSHPWLSTRLADFSNFFLAGESAGANIMLKLAMDCILSDSDVKPLSIRGLLLIQPGFHSEEKRAVMNNEHLYNMALPEGETLDYAPINPMHKAAPPLGPLSAYPHIFLNAAETDFRYDMTLRFYDIVQGMCPHVQLVITPGKGHTFHLNDPLCPEAQDLHAQLVSFLQACSTT